MDGGFLQLNLYELEWKDFTRWTEHIRRVRWFYVGPRIARDLEN